MDYSSIALKARKELGLTQSELAQKLNCTKQYVCAIENGKSYRSVPLMYFLLLRKLSKRTMKKEINSFIDNLVDNRLLELS